MLQLLQSYVGSPESSFNHLVLKNETLILYPSSSSVILLNASTLGLVRVLAFWEAFPGTRHTSDKVKCISVDSGMKLIAASMNSSVAVWSLSGVQHDTWHIHSTLALAEGRDIVSLDSKSGLLAVATRIDLSVYTLILENDLLTWSPKWTYSVEEPQLARFAPSLMYIATTSPRDNVVRIYSTTSGKQTQEIPHPRPVTNLTWRHPQASSRDDLILYTITSNTTLRIFLPLLDSPQHLQLHASLDFFSSVQFSSSIESTISGVFWLDREVVSNALTHVLEQSDQPDDTRIRKAREIIEEGWDLFLRILSDGSVVVTAVANIDRRPPTLLRHFTLQHSLPGAFKSVPSHLYVLPHPDPSLITIVASSPLITFDIHPLAFFEAASVGMQLRAEREPKDPLDELEITCFVRTPEGNGLGVVRSEGGGVWRVIENGSGLSRNGSWTKADIVVLLEGGRSFVTYSASDSTLTLHTTPPATLGIPPVTELFSLPSSGDYDSIIGITPDLAVVHVHADHAGRLTLVSFNCLPLGSSPKLILPVDPMAWSGSSAWMEHDVLLSVSEDGEIAFWVLGEGPGPGWVCTGKVRTGKVGFRMARCSSAKKSALVVPTSDGEELSIWDSKESEFASGLEFYQLHTSSEPIKDLDWTSTPDRQSILAVGFSHHVDLLCQQRMTYFDEGPGWAVCCKVDIGGFIPHSISDSIWLANGSLLVGAGHQMCLYGQPKPTEKDDETTESLFEQVARQNGPLEDYHPQMLLQCLLWEKVELVKEIICNLARDVEEMKAGTKAPNEWSTIPLERFLQHDNLTSSSNRHHKQYTFLFNDPEQNNDVAEEEFSRPLVNRLIEALELQPLSHLTPNEHAHLLVSIQTTLEIDEQQRALDSNGLRYLISMRSFYILNHRASAPSSPESSGAVPRQTGRRERLRYRDMIWAFHSESQDILLSNSIAACEGKMCWSDARALGVPIWLNSIESLKAHMEVIARNEYMAGDTRDPTACTLIYFALGKVKLVHGLWRQAAWHKEQAMMLKFLANDFGQARWRTAALKNAYALLSKRRFEYAAAFFLLGGSPRDAINVCIRQLSDFQLGIALARIIEHSNEGPLLQEILTKTVLPIAFRDGNRWLGSWTFWLLHRRDLAVRILITPLQDIARAFNLDPSKIGEPHYDDPSLALLFSQLRSKTLQAAKGTSEISGRSEFNFVLQIARVFCRMGCHVLALDLVRSWSFERPSSVVRERVESPEISPERPPLSPTSKRRSLFSLEPNLRRRTSMLIDMDIPSLPPTRPTSPDIAPHSIIQDVIKEEVQPPAQEGDLLARKAGLGSLMKSAKQDVQVPEFDMGAFF